MTDNKEPLFRYKLPGGYLFEVYPNRIEYTKKSLISNKKEVTSLRNVVSVEASRIGRALTIELTSGKTKKFPLGPKKSQEARDLILENL